ncbi:hypothetical protein [Microvirga tunisiensis]|uniref:Uncharacterized protein n=1 Tax=Microvirga tunisiensis TaxID=2108360 RepID=A0A5N7MGR3_9HYPH|nr:hypothetical protein [Microvirga tunisiensis]MPR07800.1 hypothetical protein [Microvirga tunisiensis]MPR26195.1 hypothetical protein [Microvirga tunisiensis]
MTTLSPDEKKSLAEYVRTTYGVDEYEIVGACALLWSGWESDTVAALVRLSDGRPVAGGYPTDAAPADQRVQAVNRGN